MKITIQKKQRTFTQIDNQLINDHRLSMESIGLFSYLWSKPNDWEYFKAEIMSRFNVGERALKTALDLLQDCGYISIKRQKDLKGRFISSVWTLCDKGSLFNNKLEEQKTEMPMAEKPHMDFPQVDFARVENAELLIKNNTNTEYTNKDITKKNIKKEIQENNFEEFWQLYDYKKSKSKAISSYQKALKLATHEQIIEGLKKYINFRGDDAQYWKHPTTWLNSQSWLDEYKPKFINSQNLSKHEKNRLQLEKFLKETSNYEDENDNMININDWSNDNDF